MSKPKDTKKPEPTKPKDGELSEKDLERVSGAGGGAIKGGVIQKRS